MKKTIAILGATGSVGTQAVSVAKAKGYEVDLLTGDSNVRLMEQLARELKPREVVMANESAALDLRQRLCDTDICVRGGGYGILSAIAHSGAETVVNAILGQAGLLPTLGVINEGKRLALANKESLVIAGEMIMRLARERNVEVIPVDSEHSAIFQALKSGKPSEIKRIILTASGGPFFGKTKEQLRSVTLSDTLAHPTWKMGRKITVDSATLMNKGYEVIEAAHLFGVSPEQIEVVIHRESILHSAVEYIDNTVIGELSVPDMRGCVQYAVDYPDRTEGCMEPLDLFKVGSLSFAKPDFEAFPLLSLASRALSDGGAMPAVVNAADEVAVSAFLEGRIAFSAIPEIVTEVYSACGEAKAERTLEGTIEIDRITRERANALVTEWEI